MLRRRRLPGEASRRSSDTRTGVGGADHSIDKISSATTLLACPSHSTRIGTFFSFSESHSRSVPLSPLCRARDSRTAGVMMLTGTADAAAVRKIRRTRPSAVRRRSMTVTVGDGSRSRRTRPSAVRRRRIFDIHPPPPWAPTTCGTIGGRRRRCRARRFQVSTGLPTARSPRSGVDLRYSRSCRHSGPALRRLPFASR